MNKREFTRVVAAARYRGLMRSAIHSFKYRNRRELAVPLASLLCEAVTGKLGRASWEVLLPVPTTRLRHRERGYNQALLLARAAASELPGRLRERAVRRIRPSPFSQSKLSRRERRENVRDAFAVASPPDIAGCQVLVIDDIMTTGATMDQMAMALRRAGALRVYGAVLARGD